MIQSFLLAWKQIVNNKLHSGLNIAMFALSVGMITLLLLAQKGFQDKAEKNLAGIDFIISAKGSPLQIVLCNMYHADVPTGNVELGDIKPFLNSKHPLIENAIPVSVGDNVRGYRLIGTNTDFVDLYGGKIKEGRLFAREGEVILGAVVAKKAHIHAGETVYSIHGLLNNSELGHKDPLMVTGVLEYTGTVLDRLVLTPSETIWALHDHHDHDHGADGDEAHEHHDHDHSGHDHDHDHSHDFTGNIPDPPAERELANRDEMMDMPDKEITALLIKFAKQNHQVLNMGRSINERTKAQAIYPPIVMNTLYERMGGVIKILYILGGMIAFISFIGILFSLIQGLKERRYELALIRVMGALPGKLFSLIIAESLLISIIGWIIGTLAALFIYYGINQISISKYGYSLSQVWWTPELWYLLIASLVLGIIAGLWPAWQAYKHPVSQTLGGG